MATNVAPEQLTENNYEKWSAYMKNYLIANDLWDIISNQEEDEAEFKAWQKKNAAALYVLQVSGSSELFPLIKRLDSAKACWDTLTQKFPEEEEEVEETQGQRVHGGAVTRLLAAINDNRADAVEEILNSMSEEEFELTNNDSPNPFMLACYRGSLRIVDLLYTKRNRFVEIPSGGMLPVIHPIVNGHKELMWYLYQNTVDFLLLPRNEPSARSVLECSIHHEKLDLALDLFNRWPENSTGTWKGEFILDALAGAPNIFPSRYQFLFWKPLVNLGIQ